MNPFNKFDEMTIGEIVAEDYRLAKVFKQYHIDFCCGGRRSLTEVCIQRGIDPQELTQALAAAGEVKAKPGANPSDWSLLFLIDYIVNKHHLYVREVLPQLGEYAAKVANRHGAEHPETVAIARLFDELALDLQQHLEKEEKILFPFIRQLEVAAHGKGGVPAAPFGSVHNPVQMMELEHDFAGEHLHRIRELSNDFSPPADACNTYRVLYAMLQDFEEDLQEHVHLENNILFPRAEKLEAQLLAEARERAN